MPDNPSFNSKTRTSEEARFEETLRPQEFEENLSKPGFFKISHGFAERADPRKHETLRAANL